MSIEDYYDPPLTAVFGTENVLVWKMRDGREILVADMTDEHLLNTIRFLERVCSHHDLPPLMFGPEYYAEREWETDLLKPAFPEQYGTMLEERNKRGLA